MLVGEKEVKSYITKIMDLKSAFVGLGLTDTESPRITISYYDPDSDKKHVDTYKYVGAPEQMADGHANVTYDVDSKEAFFERIAMSCGPVFDNFKAVDF